MNKEISRAIHEILLTDADGGPIDIWDYNPNKLIACARELTLARKTRIMSLSIFSEGFTKESGRQDFLPDTLVIVPERQLKKV